MKTLLLIIGTILLIVLLIIIVDLSRLVSIWQPVVKEFEIRVPTLNEAVYVKKKVWGITHDYQLLLISAHPRKSFDYDPKTDYIYHNFSYLFYRIIRDSLEIYTMTPSPVPDEFTSGVKIIQIELDNPTMMELLTTYESKGLKRFE